MAISTADKQVYTLWQDFSRLTAVNCLRFDGYQLCEHVNCESATVSQTLTRPDRSMLCGTLHCISTRDVPIVLFCNRLNDSSNRLLTV